MAAAATDRRNLALIVVDVQNDFISGSLAVKDAEAIVSPINELLRGKHFDTVVFSRDSHPVGHVSFASTHGKQPFTSIQLPNPALLETRNPSSTEPTMLTQELWPDHCVAGTSGWEFHPALDVEFADFIIDKGQRAARDSYSAFWREADSDDTTKLGRELSKRGVVEVYCVGLAYDYCVGSTAIDAAAHGFKTYVINSMVKGVMPETCASMSERMDAAGVTIVDSFEA